MVQMKKKRQFGLEGIVCNPKVSYPFKKLSFCVLKLGKIGIKVSAILQTRRRRVEVCQSSAK